MEIDNQLQIGFFKPSVKFFDFSVYLFTNLFYVHHTRLSFSVLLAVFVLIISLFGFIYLVCVRFFFSFAAFGFCNLVIVVNSFKPSQQFFFFFNYFNLLVELVLVLVLLHQ